MKNFYLLLIAIFTINIANAQWQKTDFSCKNCVVKLGKNNTNIFATTKDSGIFISNNSSMNWTLINNNLTNITACAIYGTNIIIGSGSGIYLSIDNGTNWNCVNTNFTNSTYFLINGTDIYAIDNGGGIHLSINNGTSWTSINTNLTNSLSTIAIIGTNIFAATTGGGIFLSTNNGTTWTPINSGLTNLSVYNLAVSGTYLYAATNNGDIFYTTNNGTSWANLNTNSTLSWPPSSLIVNYPNIFFGNVNGLYYSTNNGINWNYSLNIDVISLAISGTYLYASTYFGDIWRISLPNILDVNQIQNIKNEITSFPNPATNQTTIIYPQLIEEGKLLVYNVLGQLVYEENLIKGSSQLTLNIQNYKAGLYKVIIKDKGIIKGQVSLIKK